MDGEPFYFTRRQLAGASFAATAIMGIAPVLQSYGGGAAIHEADYHLAPDYHDPLGVAVGVGLTGLTAYLAIRARYGR